MVGGRKRPRSIVKHAARTEISGHASDQMSTLEIRFCVTCAKTQNEIHLERCGICARYFCTDCAHRAIGGRRFCSAECAKSYFFHGEPDDDDEDPGSEE